MTIDGDGIGHGQWHAQQILFTYKLFRNFYFYLYLSIVCFDFLVFQRLHNGRSTAPKQISIQSSVIEFCFEPSF